MHRPVSDGTSQFQPVVFIHRAAYLILSDEPLPHLTKEGFGSIIKVGLKTGPMYFMVYVNNDRDIPNQA